MLDSLRYKAHALKRKLLFPLRKRFKLINAWDDPRRDKVLCKSCNRLVSFFAYHSGFSAITPIYCGDCPDVLLLDDHEARFPYGNATCKPTSNFGLNWKPEIESIDSALPKCPCNGTLRYLNPPRCPHCLGLLFGENFEEKPFLKDRLGYSIVCRKTYKLADLQKV